VAVCHGWPQMRRRLHGGGKFNYPYNATEWGEVSKLCEQGKFQSPIDLPKYDEKLRQAQSLVFEHMESSFLKPVAKWGGAHSLTFDVEKKAYMVVNGEKYWLRQMHLHTGSEHTVDGKQYDMEMHKVHTTEDGKHYAVIGILFEVESDADKIKNSKSIDAIQELLDLFTFTEGTEANWNTIPSTGLDLVNIGGTYKLDKFLTLLDSNKYWEYSGSLTTPGCNEGVRWHNMMEVLQVTSEQIKKIQDISGFAQNFRDVQPLNERYIYPVAEAHWGYPYDAEKWGKFFPTCQKGTSQSPVDLPERREGLKQEDALVFEHKNSKLLKASSHLQGGHSLHFDVDQTSHMMVNNEKFILRQWHIHTGSENRIAGKQFAVEMHKVHTNADGSKYAVIGIMFDEVEDSAGKGKASVEAWDKIIKLFRFPNNEGNQDNWLRYLPDGKLPVGTAGYELDTFLEMLDPLRYWSYTGSLTTPGCTEGVAWHSMMDPLAITKSQVQALNAISGFTKNFRPPQPLNGRTFEPQNDLTIQIGGNTDKTTEKTNGVVPVLKRTGDASSAAVLFTFGSFVSALVVSLLF